MTQPADLDQVPPRLGWCMTGHHEPPPGRKPRKGTCPGQSVNTVCPCPCHQRES